MTPRPIYQGVQKLLEPDEARQWHFTDDLFEDRALVITQAVP